MSVNTKILLVVLENPLQQLLYTIGAVLFRKETQKKKKKKDCKTCYEQWEK